MDRHEEGKAQRPDWDLEDLIVCWTLVRDDWALVGNNTAPTRLGLALPLMYFELDAHLREACFREVAPVASEGL